jgi:hypothetical protein
LAVRGEEELHLRERSERKRGAGAGVRRETWVGERDAEDAGRDVLMSMAHAFLGRRH